MINNYCRSSPIDLARGAFHFKVADHWDVEEYSALFLLKPRRELKRTIRKLGNAGLGIDSSLETPLTSFGASGSPS
jgi:hypothetical protein